MKPAKPTPLHPDGVASIVLGEEADAPSPGRVRRGSALAPDGVAAIVLGERAHRRWAVVAGAIVVGGGLHVGFGTAALTKLNDTAKAPRSAQEPLRIEHVVDLAPPEPVAPPEPIAPQPVAPTPPLPSPALAPPGPKLPAPTEPEAPGAPAPSPAEAAQVVAADADSAQVADFTGFDMTMGNGALYAGGITAGSGESRSAVRERSTEAGISTKPSAPSRAHGVGAPARQWECPWPAEAAALQVDEQSVVLRAYVRPDGTVESARLISDPGHGFGAVALRCIQRQRFPAATDENGRAIAAASPPVRVRFVRPE